MTVEVNGYKINYDTSGTGEDVVILHGWGYDITLLEGLKNSLNDKYRVTLIDLPGHGMSSEPERPVTTTSLLCGISRSIFLRLCTLAPRILILLSIRFDAIILDFVVLRTIATTICNTFQASL